jgi:two-component system, OmpR family, KDP operon response regulator KdpE
MSAVLVVCGDRRSRRQLANVMRHAEFEAKAVDDPNVASRLLRGHQFAAIVVADLEGLALPDFVGELRVQSDIPIVVVSKLTEEWDKVLALDAGADDYLTEPYGVDELLARLRATMRRFARAIDDQPVVTEDFTVFVRDRRFVMADGVEVRLTETQWKVLAVLLGHPGHLVSRAELLRSVWGPDAVDKSNYLRVHMVGIRRKVERDPAHPRYFVTVPGLGLRFVPTPADARCPAS